MKKGGFWDVFTDFLIVDAITSEQRENEKIQGEMAQKLRALEADNKKMREQLGVTSTPSQETSYEPKTESFGLGVAKIAIITFTGLVALTFFEKSDKDEKKPETPTEQTTKKEDVKKPEVPAAQNTKKEAAPPYGTISGDTLTGIYVPANGELVLNQKCLSDITCLSDYKIAAASIKQYLSSLPDNGTICVNQAKGVLAKPYKEKNITTSLVTIMSASPSKEHSQESFQKICKSFESSGLGKCQQDVLQGCFKIADMKAAMKPFVDFPYP